MYTVILFFTIVALYAIHYWLKWLRNPLRKLPGPSGWPLVGNITQMNPNTPHIRFVEWSKQHGDIFRINLFNQTYVVLNSAELLQESLYTRSMDFAGRPENVFRANYVFYGSKDIGFQSYNPVVKLMRRASHAVLKQYGTGKHKIEEIMQKYCLELCLDLEKLDGQVFNVKHILHEAVTNIIATIIFGYRLEKGSTETKEILEIDRKAAGALHPIKGAELDQFPWLRHFNLKSFQMVKAAKGKLDIFLDKHFKHIKETFDPSNIRGAFDFLIAHIEDNANNLKNDEIGELTEFQAKMVIVDLILAGTATSSATIYIFVLLMINFPEIQKKLQDEVDRVVGHDRAPELEDKKNMPYFEATLLELWRYSSFVPLLIPHLTMTDTRAGGYEIPKDTTVLMNCYAVHHNENVYPNPEKVMPERFLDKDGSLLPQDNPVRRNMFIFGGGRRICVGEQLAKNRVFLLMAHMMQKITFLPEEGKPVPSPDPRYYEPGISYMPHDYNVQVTKRK